VKGLQKTSLGQQVLSLLITNMDAWCFFSRLSTWRIAGFPVYFSITLDILLGCATPFPPLHRRNAATSCPAPREQYIQENGNSRVICFDRSSAQRACDVASWNYCFLSPQRKKKKKQHHRDLNLGRRIVQEYA